jgi:curved DNA-binding protein CbpA
MTAYELFGVPEDAPPEQIEAAWKALMKRFHPDLNPGADQRAAQEINRAHDVLKDPDQRARYDAALAAARRPVRMPSIFIYPMSGSGTTINAGTNTTVSWIFHQ